VGSNATAIANMSDGSGGSVISYTVTDGGTGYTNGVIVVVDPPPSLQSEMGGFVGATLNPPSNGLIDPTSVYNVRISPVRNALRWLPWIMASYPDPETGQLIFTDGDGNIYAYGLLATDPVESAVVHENQTLMLSDLASSDVPVLKNEIVTFNYPLGFNEWLNIYSTKYGLIKYNVNDGPWRYGYIWDLKYDMYQGMGEFTLKTAVI
jgi:hypothetical protein